jgi:hypothetical protein
MSAKILTFGCRALPDQLPQAARKGGPLAASATLMSVPEAACYVYLQNGSPRACLAEISALTGVSVNDLCTLWAGAQGLREASLRFALSMAMG